VFILCMFVMINQRMYNKTSIMCHLIVCQLLLTALRVQCRIKSACVAYHMVIKSVFYFNLDLFCNVRM
jgi:hypothetical protein